jgi:RNA polymerase sigma factor (TIGR02999 family)
MRNSADPGTTRVLSELAGGDESAAQRLLPLVYAELRALAGSYMRRPGGATLQPTALVHEAYVRLVGVQQPQWQGRAHFMAVAAKAMRQLLVDHARRRQARKRGGGLREVTLDEALVPQRGRAIDLVALDDALQDLARLSARQARIIELRFFGGLTIAETAVALGVGTTTVEDDFAMAKAWLARELAPQ